MWLVEHRISATELARTLGDVLARVRYRGDSFVVERNGTVVARLVPATEKRATLAEVFAAWRSAGPPDPEFADALEEIDSLDWPPDDPWVS